MKKLTLVLIVGFALSIYSACRTDQPQAWAGFLHRAYSGIYEANGIRYVVNTDNSIDVQHKAKCTAWVESNCYGCPSNYTPPVCSTSEEWSTRFTILNRDELHNLITGLQTVEKELNDADKEK